MWKNIGLGAAFVVVIAAPEALHVVSAAPQSRADTNASPAKPVTDNAFVPTCKATQVVDSRPDPAWVGESFAHDNCVAPAMPAVLDGYTASLQQIVAGVAAVKRYAAKADRYQQCIGNFVASGKAAAGKDKQTLNAAQITIENHRIFASQADKKKAQSQIEVAIVAFNELGSECE